MAQYRTTHCPQQPVSFLMSKIISSCAAGHCTAYTAGTISITTTGIDTGTLWDIDIQIDRAGGRRPELYVRFAVNKLASQSDMFGWVIPVSGIRTNSLRSAEAGFWDRSKHHAHACVYSYVCGHGHLRLVRSGGATVDSLPVGRRSLPDRIVRRSTRRSGRSRMQGPALGRGRSKHRRFWGLSV